MGYFILGFGIGFILAALFVAYGTTRILDDFNTTLKALKKAGATITLKRKKKNDRDD